jgi:regulatory protein
LRGSQSNARRYALKLLSYRGRSERELEERLLKKGITESEASSTIQYLKEIGLIDDLSLAETLKREALTSKLLSRRGAKRYLLNRGIPREIADLVFSHDEDTDYENAGILVEKKLRKLAHYPPDIVRRKLYGLLLRRGYPSGLIMKTLRDNKLKEEED